MSEEKSKKTSDKNPSYWDEVFPDVNSILSNRMPDIPTIIEDCVFILDTNILLAPYNAGSGSLVKIIDILSRLKVENRLFIPEQVIKEFVKNRPKKISEVYGKVENIKNNLPKIQKINLPVLEKDSICKDIEDLYKEIGEKKKEINGKLNDLQRKIRDWNGNDPVSLSYNELITKAIVIQHSFSKEEINSRLKIMSEHKIPPGYMDSKKDDGGIGDVLIWLSILDLGKKDNCNIVLVTNDEKADWYQRNDKKGFSVRYELVDEFFRHSEGNNFVAISFPRFLELMEADDATVEEFKKESKSTRQQIINALFNEEDRQTINTNLLRNLVSHRPSSTYELIPNTSCFTDGRYLFDENFDLFGEYVGSPTGYFWSPVSEEGITDTRFTFKVNELIQTNNEREKNEG